MLLKIITRMTIFIEHLPERTSIFLVSYAEEKGHSGNTQVSHV